MDLAKAWAITGVAVGTLKIAIKPMSPSGRSQVRLEAGDRSLAVATEW